MGRIHISIPIGTKSTSDYQVDSGNIIPSLDPRLGRWVVKLTKSVTFLFILFLVIRILFRGGQIAS